MLCSKSNWALCNMQFFPVDVNRAPLRELLRVPGIGPKSARRIVTARRTGKLGLAELKRIGVVLKRARYFIVASDQPCGPRLAKESVTRALIDPKVYAFGVEQLTMFDLPGVKHALPGPGDVRTVGEAVEEAVLCLQSAL